MCQLHSQHLPLLYFPSLYQKIDTEKLQCLNEAEEGSGKKVFRPWDERLDKSKVDYRVKYLPDWLYNFSVGLVYVTAWF